jgi:ABC-type Fe3+ transport system permease subunit
MVPWWKRLIYSLASVLIASIACGLVFEFHRLLDHEAHFQAGDLLWFIFPVLVFSIPGWVLATPMVLTATNFSGWRLWFNLAIGSSIGPILMLGLALYERLTSPHLRRFLG